MTMIMGLNLSDKIYLAADTRITEKPSMRTQDNVIKITPVWSRSIQNQAFYNKNEVFIAVAGDVEFATFFFEELQKRIISKQLSSDVRKLSNQIDDFVKELVNNWTIDQGKEYVSFCAIFGGISRYRKKQINKKKLLFIMEGYKKLQEKNIPEGRAVIQRLLDSGDEKMHQINKGMMRDRGKTSIEVLEEGYIPTLSDSLLGYLVYGKEIEEPDSFIFGLAINMRTSFFQKEEAEWGECLAYGTNGITKNDIDPDMISVFEFSRAKKRPDLLDKSIMTTTITSMAEKKNTSAIGGTVAIIEINKDGASFSSKDIDRTVPNGLPTRLVLDGKSSETVFFYRYMKKDAQAEL